MSKLTFMVCPHDTVKEPERWYCLIQHIDQKLGVEFQFDISLDFQDFHDNLASADMVYINPTDGLKMLETSGFVPVARPQDLYDEAVFVANTEVNAPALSMLQGAPLITVRGLIPTNIALHMLQSNAVQPGELHYKESWLSVISAVWNREADFGIVYTDTYNGLSEQGHSMVQKFAESDEKLAFHYLIIGPALAARKEEIEHLFQTMHTDAQGQQVLDKLHISRWLPVTQEEIATMQHIMHTYA